MNSYTNLNTKLKQRQYIRPSTASQYTVQKVLIRAVGEEQRNANAKSNFMDKKSSDL